MNYPVKFIFIVLLASLFSCRSSKELIYMKDAADKENLQDIPLQDAEHHLKPADILYVSIKSMNAEVNALFNPESSMEQNSSSSSSRFQDPSGAYLYGYEVDTDGNVNLPMLGKIKVAGLSVLQAEPTIQKKADEVINNAIVKVKLLNFKITVMGEVRSPGVFYNYNNSIDVMEAIAMAGGNTDYATINKVMVMRKTASGKKTFLLDLSKKDMLLSEAYLLQPNDFVIVQPDKNKNLQINAQAISLFFSSAALLIVILTLAF